MHKMLLSIWFIPKCHFHQGMLLNSTIHHLRCAGNETGGNLYYFQTKDVHTLPFKSFSSNCFQHW